MGMNKPRMGYCPYNNIRLYMTYRGYTIDSFAEAVGTSKASMYNYISGKHLPDIDVAWCMTKVLDVTFEDLFDKPFKYLN